MNQSASKISLPAPVTGALFMISAGIAFAGVNAANQFSQQFNGVTSTAVAFYQYLFALIFSLPWIWRYGRKALASKHLGWHLIRVALAAGGVQAFVFSFSVLPIPQIIALVMVSPFFVVAGAGLFLGERITLARVGATIVAFVGAMVILEPWSASFSAMALLPILAAFLWAGSSLITKFLTRDEKPETITVYLLLLLTPINFVFYGASGFAVPAGSAFYLLVGLGVLTAAANYFLTRAYAAADATFLQPFDDLKLPVNTLASWIVFSYAPTGNFWPGAAIILAASLFIAWNERAGRKPVPA
ncbi:MAG: DMT family transporter [Alphaproteobacteria bacterium]|nr:DMT family transporter [Alphaproteobacteria bacterium]